MQYLIKDECIEVTRMLDTTALCKWVEKTGDSGVCIYEHINITFLAVIFIITLSMLLSVPFFALVNYCSEILYLPSFDEVKIDISSIHFPESLLDIHKRINSLKDSTDIILPINDFSKDVSNEMFLDVGRFTVYESAKRLMSKMKFEFEMHRKTLREEELISFEDVWRY